MSEKTTASGALVLLLTALCTFAQDDLPTDIEVPPSASPADVVAALHAGIVALVASGPARSIEERYARFRPIAERAHDFPYIAEVTVRRYWGDWSEAERRDFLAAFDRLSIMTYVTRFENATPQTFALLGSEDAGSGRVLVRAMIVRDAAENISLDYLMHETQGGWRIINVLADQVSDLALKRAEYHRILADGDVARLIAELEAQTAELQ